jgi:Protein of unknown function (DUF551)
MNKWNPIETAPLDCPVLLWWRPNTRNPHAEAAVIGQVSSFERGKFWNGQRGEYEDLSHITHWMPLPDKPTICQREYHWYPGAIHPKICSDCGFPTSDHAGLI